MGVCFLAMKSSNSTGLGGEFLLRINMVSSCKRQPGRRKCIIGGFPVGWQIFGCSYKIAHAFSRNRSRNSHHDGVRLRADRSDWAQSAALYRVARFETSFHHLS